MDSNALLTRKNIESNLPRIMGLAAGLPVKRDRSDILSDYRHDSLDSLAGLAGYPNPRQNRDWAQLMSASLTKVITSNFWPVYQSRLDQCAGIIPLENFKDTTIATIAPPDLHEVFEDQEPIFSPLTATTTTGKIRSFESIMRVSTQVWSTLGADLVRAVSGLSQNIYALHLQLIAECLQGITFTADNSSGNSLVIAAGLPALATGLDGALASLERRYCTGAVIITAPGQTASASMAIKECGLNITVIANPFLTASEWYLLPSPAEKTVIGRLVLISDAFNGAGNPAIQWTKIDNQRYGYYCPVDVGYSAINTDCIYRGGVE